jgi:hypothetical protein
MGLSLGVDVASQRILNAVTLLTVEDGRFSGVSIADFLQDLKAYAAKTIAVVEPWVSAKHELPPHDVNIPQIDFGETIAKVRAQFTFRPVQVRGCSIWVHVPVCSQFSSVLALLDPVTILSLGSPLVVLATDLFSGFGNVRSLSDVLIQSPPKRSLPGIIARTVPVPTGAQSRAESDSDCDLIYPHLYLGSETALVKPKILKKCGITHIVSLGCETSPCDSSLPRFTVNLKDYAFAAFQSDFWDGIDFVGQHLDSGGTVLVHCRKGISRSPALCIGFLMDKKGYSFDDALALVKSKRPQVVLNPAFEQQLKERSCRLLGSPSVAPPVVPCKSCVI